MIYRIIKDIVKILILPFKSKLNFKFPKSEILYFHKKVQVSANPGYLICRNRTYGLGYTNFRSLDIFLKIELWDLERAHRSWSPELEKKVAGVVEEAP